RRVIRGDELRLEDVGAGVDRDVLFQAVVHRDQDVVHVQVDVTLVGPDVGGRLGDDLGTRELEDDVNRRARDRGPRGRLEDLDGGRGRRPGTQRRGRVVGCRA